MIEIEEIPVENIQEFFKIHIEYLIEGKFITSQEDIDYFSGDEYREIIKSHMIRDKDKHHMIYFVKDNHRIGVAQYNTYQSEDGKCFILDYWLFNNYRGKGLGVECFNSLEAYTKSDGAIYYELNSHQKESINFWQSVGFVYKGLDEYEEMLWIKK